MKTLFDANLTVKEAEDLIDQGHKVNVLMPEYGNRSPMHLAASRGDVGLLKLFISRGGDRDIVGDVPNIPLHEAISDGHLEAVKFLVRDGSLLDRSPMENAYSLRLARKWGHPKVAEFLEQCGVTDELEGSNK